MNQKMLVIYFLTLSTIGATLIVIVNWLSPLNVYTIHIFDKIVVALAFILSCLFGITLAFWPKWIKRLINKEGHDILEKDPETKKRKHQGHHPDCEPFKNHTIKIKNKILCTGCTGLAIGSIVSILLMGAYISLPLPNGLPLTGLNILIMLGLALVFQNYIETVSTTRNVLLHLISNIFLIIGFFFVVIGIFQLTGRITYGIFGVIISFLFLDTRIQLSLWRHAKICKDCSENCKVYFN